MNKYILSAIFFSAFNFFSYSEAKLSFNSKISEGEKYYQNKDYQKAFESYKQAQVEEPNNNALKYNLASTAYRLGKFDESEKLFDSLTDSENKDMKQKAFYNLGNTQYKLSKLEEAEKSYIEALKLNPDDISAKKNLEKVREEIKKRKKEDQDRKKQNNNNNQKDKQANNKNKSGDNKDNSDQKNNPNKKDNKEEGKNKDNKNDKNSDNKNDSKNNQKNDQNKENKSQQQKDQQANNSMKKSEADKWLNMVEDKGKEVMRGQILKKSGQSYQSTKDW